MTRIIVALTLVGTLSACGGGDLSNLPKRDGPQAQSPYLQYDPNAPAQIQGSGYNHPGGFANGPAIFGAAG